MVKRLLITVVTVFIVWAILDFLVHGYILGSAYENTAELWRPMENMKVGLMQLVGIIYATSFVGIYYVVISPKSMKTALLYGLLFGIAIGFPMGFGTYSFMPIPVSLAIAWFVFALIKTIIGGAIAGAIIKSTIPNTDNS